MMTVAMMMTMAMIMTIMMMMVTRMTMKIMITAMTIKVTMMTMTMMKHWWNSPWLLLPFQLLKNYLSLTLILLTYTGVHFCLIFSAHHTGLFCIPVFASEMHWWRRHIYWSTLHPVFQFNISIKLFDYGANSVPDKDNDRKRNFGFIFLVFGHLFATDLSNFWATCLSRGLNQICKVLS